MNVTDEQEHVAEPLLDALPRLWTLLAQQSRGSPHRAHP